MWWLLGASVASAIDVGAVVEEELSRSMATLSQEELAPHYVAVAVEGQTSFEIGARDGTLWFDRSGETRYIDVDLRVGTPELDSTHPLRGVSAFDDDTRSPRFVPFAGPGQEAALRHALWQEIDQRYRDARERFVLLQTNRTVRVEEEDVAPDFEPRTPVTATVDVPDLTLDTAAWREVLVDVSGLLEEGDVVHSSEVRLSAVQTTRTFIDTEGAHIEDGSIRARLSVQASAIADDGDEVSLYRAVDVHDPASLMTRSELTTMAERLLSDIEALRSAPRVGSYTGPVILSGRATGVFFHEVMGHRVEGHRQKRDSEGKTFLGHVGKAVLPEWVDVYDDPTIAHMAGHDLNGHYQYDDEGVAAQRAELVDEGIFQGFLMSRSPLSLMPSSNGHGRRSSGRPPLARMGNTIIEAREAVPYPVLRERLLAELRRQDKSFGYIVEEIEGGFTMTGRVTPNAFNVRASLTRRVWTDGRPDEIVRGIDLVGTPLVAFQNIMAASETSEVFNGVCGAESGWVPVSAVAPAMLFRQLEFQLKEKSSIRPPLLPKPRPDAAAALPMEER